MSLPSLKEFLPNLQGYEEGKLFLLADTGFDIKAALPPAFPQDSGVLAQSPLQNSGKVLRIEMLAVLPAPTDTSRAAPDEILRKIVRIANSVHSMEGIEYWSASRQRMRTLYAEAYRIDLASGRMKLQDPGEASLASGASWAFNAFLRDLTFGGNVIKYEVGLGSSYVTMSNENVASVNYLLIPLVPAGGMKSRLLVIPTKEGLIVHFLSTVKALDIVAKRVFESAGNKSLAVLWWFARESAAAGLAREQRLPVNIDEVAKAN